MNLSWPTLPDGYSIDIYPDGSNIYIGRATIQGDDAPGRIRVTEGIFFPGEDGYVLINNDVEYLSITGNQDCNCRFESCTCTTVPCDCVLPAEPVTIQKDAEAVLAWISRRLIEPPCEEGGDCSYFNIQAVAPLLGIAVYADYKGEGEIVDIREEPLDIFVCDQVPDPNN